MYMILVLLASDEKLVDRPSVVSDPAPPCVIAFYAFHFSPKRNYLRTFPSSLVVMLRLIASLRRVYMFTLVVVYDIIGVALLSICYARHMIESSDDENFLICSYYLFL